MVTNREGTLNCALIGSNVERFYRAVGINFTYAVIAAFSYVMRGAMCKIAIVLVILDYVSAALYDGEIDAAKEVLSARIRCSRSRFAREDNYEYTNGSNACGSGIGAAFINEVCGFLIDFVIAPFFNWLTFEGFEVCLDRGTVCSLVDCGCGV